MNVQLPRQFVFVETYSFSARQRRCRPRREAGARRILAARFLENEKKPSLAKTEQFHLFRAEILFDGAIHCVIERVLRSLPIFHFGILYPLPCGVTSLSILPGLHTSLRVEILFNGAVLGDFERILRSRRSPFRRLVFMTTRRKTQVSSWPVRGPTVL